MKNLEISLNKIEVIKLEKNSNNISLVKNGYLEPIVTSKSNTYSTLI